VFHFWEVSHVDPMRVILREIRMDPAGKYLTGTSVAAVRKILAVLSR
jgi:hypothetical protein